MNPYSPITWLYVQGFSDQNLKRWIFEVIAGNLDKRISVKRYVTLMLYMYFAPGAPPSSKDLQVDDIFSIQSPVTTKYVDRQQ